jgi:hypothetical protein
VTTVHLFPDESLGPRPAWQVIDAAREMRLTGELTLMTTPLSRVYLRDGVVYFADKATDGGLGIRLVLEGVLTRAQLSNGTVLVNGAEHLGRLFERDATVDRDAVELAVEMFVDDVLTQVAEEPVEHWQIALYKRHPSGVDRWYPHVTRVLTRVVERAAPATEVPVTTERAAAAPDAPAQQTHLVSPPTAPVELIVEPMVEPTIEPVAESVVEPVAESVVEPVAEYVIEPVAEPVIEPAAESVVHTQREDVPPADQAEEARPLPAPANEPAPITAPPASRLISAEVPTNVVPVLPVDTLLQPRLATGDQPVVVTDTPSVLAEEVIPELEAIERMEDIADVDPDPVVAPVAAVEPTPDDSAALVDELKAAIHSALAGLER